MAEFVRLGKTLADTELSRKYPDLYNSDATTYLLKGAQDTKTIISTFRIPEAPPFGSSELKSLNYYFYTNAITIGNSLHPIRLAAYKFKNEDDISFDSSKLTANTGLVKGTTPTIQAEPLFFATTSNNKILDGYSDNFTGLDNGLMGDAEYRSMGRKSYALIDPYMEPYDFMAFGSHKNTWQRDDGEGTLANHFKMDQLKALHGTKLVRSGSTGTGDDKVTNTNERVIITITSWDSERWRTKVNRDDEDLKWVPKDSKELGMSTSHWIRSSEMIESDDHLYGDEVKPSNSMFTYVRGSREVFETKNQTDPASTDGASAQLAMGCMLKFTSENASTGQCAQFFAYHQDNVSTDYYGPLSSTTGSMNSAVDGSGVLTRDENGSDVVAVIKNVPAPYNVGVPIPGIFPHVSESGKAGSDENETNPGNMRVASGAMISPGTIQIDFTIADMAPAYMTGSSTPKFLSIVGRAFTVLISDIAPEPAVQRFRDYLDVITGKASGSAAWDHNAIGFSMLKDEEGVVRIFGLDQVLYSTTNKPTGWNHDYNVQTNVTNSLTPIPESTPLRLIIMENDCLDRLEWRIFLYQKEELSVGVGDWALIAYDIIPGHLGAVSTTSDATANYNSGGLSFGDGKMDATVSGTQKNHSARHMSFWLTNHENQYAGANNDANVSSTTSDMRTRIDVDSIQFIGYNNALTNATILSNTGQGKYVSPLINRSPATIPFNPQAFYGIYLGTDTAGSDKSWLAGSIPDVLDRNVHGVTTKFASYVYDSSSVFKAYNRNTIGPGSTVLCWGFSNLSDFDLNSTGGVERYIFLQNFLCTQLKLNDPIDYNLMSGGYTIDLEKSGDQRVALGLQNYPQSISPQITKNALKVGTDTSGTAGTTADDIIVTGTLGTSGFSEKGFLQIKFNSSLSGYHGPGAASATRTAPDKRECVYASARILRAYKEAGGVTIQTDCLEPFACETSQEYMVYLMGADAQDRVNYAKGIKVVSANKEDGIFTIKLDWDGLSDANTQISLIQDHLLPHLWISPVAYWMWVYVPNYKDGMLGNPTPATALNWNPTGGAVQTTSNNLDALKALPSKSYGSCMVTATKGTPGATYNEWKFSNSGGGTALLANIRGLNEAAWDLSLTTEDGMFDLQDFGFGSFEQSDDSNTGFKGGHVGLAAPNKSAYGKFRLPGIIEGADLKPNDFVALYISLKDTSIDHSIQVKTRNASTVDFPDPESGEPLVAAVYFDALPQPITDLKVKPYEHDAYIPEYNWTTQDEDLWYGIFHFDIEPIYHQYHKAIFYMPLNEQSSAEGILHRDSPEDLLKVYNYENGEKSHQKLSSVKDTYGVAGSTLTSHGYINTFQTLTEAQGLAGNTVIFGGSRYYASSQLNGGAGTLFGRGVISHPIGTSVLRQQDDTVLTDIGYTSSVPSDEFSLSMHITPDSKPPAKYQLRAAGVDATFSLNTPTYFNGDSTRVDKLREDLDATETEIDVDCTNIMTPQYIYGKLDGTNDMRDDFGTQWISTGEDNEFGGNNGYDLDDNVYIKIDSEIMRVVAVNPGTRTQLTKGGTTCKLDSGYYNSSTTNTLGSNDYILRTNEDMSSGLNVSLANGDIVMLFGKGTDGYTTEIMKVGNNAASDFAGTSSSQPYLYARHSDWPQSGNYSRRIDNPSNPKLGRTVRMVLDLSSTTDLPNNYGELLFNKIGQDHFEDVTALRFWEADYSGRVFDGVDTPGVGNRNCLPGSAGERIHIEKYNDSSKQVWYNYVSTVKVGNVYTVTVTWAGGATGPITDTFATGNGVFWSLTDSTAPSGTHGPSYRQANNKMYTGTGSGSVLSNAANSYDCDSKGFYKITSRSVTVERGIGTATAGVSGATHTNGATIYKSSDKSPTIGGITLSNIDDVEYDGTSLNNPPAYDSINRDQMWRYAIIQVGDEKFVTGDFDPDSNWSSGNWARNFDGTDWDTHSNESIYVIPRHYFFHSFTGHNTFNAGLNPLDCNYKPVLSAFLDSDGKINVSAFIENQSTTTPLLLKSKSSIPFDGMTPTHVGITFDSQIPSQNLKLFLNGKLEDATGFRTTTGTTNNLQDNATGTGGEPLRASMGTICIGGMAHQTNVAATTFGTNGFDGAIEDVALWSRVVNFIEPQEGTFKYMKPYIELENDENKAMANTLYAKLFIKDYHNIRGKSDKEVRSSPLTVLRKSGFALNTT